MAESDQRQALLGYSQTVQKAFGEVADALIDYRKYRELRVREEQSVATLKESVRLATDALPRRGHDVPGGARQPAFAVFRAVDAGAGPWDTNTNRW